MMSSSDPKPGCSAQTDINTAIVPDPPKQAPNKLDQLTSEEIDNYITSETLTQYEFSGDRHLLIYNKNQIEEVKAETCEEPGDEFFELSSGEANRLLRDIIRTRDQLENGQLMTKAMRDLNSSKRTLATLYQYSYSVVRLHMPDGHVIQAVFKPLESVGKVKDYFRQCLASPDLEFYIYFTPPKSVPQDSSTLLDLHCVPTANFYFGVVEDCRPSGRGAATSRPDNGTSAESEALRTSIERGTETSDVDRPVKTSDVTVKTSTVNENGKMSGTDVAVKTSDVNGKTSGVMESRTSDTLAESSGGYHGAGHVMSLQTTSSVLVSYVRPDIVAKAMVARSVADAKAAEFRMARNPALSFMDETDDATLPSSSKSPGQLTLPVSMSTVRPRTSPNKIPKWFKPGGK